MKLIVGLGNPGEKYAGTRHNVGFDCIDYCANEMNIDISQTKFKGIYGSGLVNGEKVYLLKPLTYMNLSGESVRPFMDYFNIDLEDLVVIYDDMDLPAGKIRLRQKGSAGGHNGIKSLIQHLGTPEFNRIRIGVDRPKNGESIVNYVLGSYHPEELEDVKQSIVQSTKAVEAWTQKSFLEVMNEFN
ncbi:aminoacyl-tRNA hydrolase [Halalkalibacter akibai]|uniref:Peptidyl-tRNA hydrolase n=1 Tax=Halalkalibacter akibai (strain ATCC 43226 / DSM 21942 / CIP 109018 / JCM 9157 / 1139) TaxID=1236973 RepID=W4QZ37_HALA3|nr:aminoacyl-tRNA hydrolase [Halalkalibacter akibai]GAE36569.1 peptidyl-tRNA hydrolase [Halalkalibacter akibai JCM 9157]